MFPDREDGPHGSYLTVGGKRLFVDIRGDRAAPALLYLHGGPGTSCHEFMKWQGDLLSRELLLIGLDQRGVLRSDPVGPGDVLSEQVLVDDCEAIREALDLDGWSLLGHSFGGRVALRYACQYPDRVATLIFENPAWDIRATELARLPKLAAMLDGLGRADEARQCRELAARPDPFADGYPAGLIGPVLNSLGIHWYLADPGRSVQMAEAGPALPEALLQRAGAHGERLLAQPEFLESMLPLLPGLRMPALLILGKSDLVTSPDQAEAFRRDVPDGRVRIFGTSGHFVQFEQAAEYAETVTGFVLGRFR
ncbi:MAG TPA: alpha/beta hydrolase [Streptosporangiaceae bacterium]|jgi:proline iminopeptidase